MGGCLVSLWICEEANGHPGFQFYGWIGYGDPSSWERACSSVTFLP